MVLSEVWLSSLEVVIVIGLTISIIILFFTYEDIIEDQGSWSVLIDVRKNQGFAQRCWCTANNNISGGITPRNSFF